MGSKQLNRALELLAWCVRHIERNTCTHEETHRGGSIWTICDQCGEEWADDEGGLVPHVEPPELEQARDLIDASQEAGQRRQYETLRRKFEKN